MKKDDNTVGPLDELLNKCKEISKSIDDDKKDFAEYDRLQQKFFDDMDDYGKKKFVINRRQQRLFNRQYILKTIIENYNNENYAYECRSCNNKHNIEYLKTYYKCQSLEETKKKLARTEKTILNNKKKIAAFDDDLKIQNKVLLNFFK